MKKIVIAIIILTLFCSNTTYAENASALLNVYGIKKLVSVEIEEQLLQNITKEYHNVSLEINKDKMIEQAIDIYSSSHDYILDTYDTQINILQQELEDLKETIYKNRKNSVETLLEFDSKYKSIEHELKDLINEKEVQKAQINMLDYDNKNITTMQKKQNKLKHKLNNQKKAYEEAVSYPELGDITNLEYPLKKPSHVTSDFGTRLDPIGKVKQQFHNGIDLSAQVKTEVTALFNGTVETAGYSNELGYYVILNHGKGIKTIYGHLNHYIVYQGQQVNQYEVIASSGNSGSRSTGPHLHLGLYINGEAVDPSKVFK
ncbi:peptidoglycan DD-metalloendopeptidase family protein [Vallitalea guaymasensis]|uniref:peptidoglycan DD-metalloendopeptidase family protein n=1 Tax=Vallitalea guaymasensis TaxID=1185412 RepID=UPI00272ABF9C|nr:peptidoglycan DD-metalloendopeptidase family protein [Vallitalea guaymasensis]